MKYKAIDCELFVKNRSRFSKALKPNSLAIFNSNDIMPTNADGTMPFRQNNDLFHLSGVDQEESIVLIFPDAKAENHREILFLKETNAHIAVWEGAKLDKTQAFEASGIKTVYWLDAFEAVLKDLSERDHRDSNRQHSPLKISSNAHLIDTSELSIEAAITHAIELVRLARKKP